MTQPGVSASHPTRTYKPGIKHLILSTSATPTREPVPHEAIAGRGKLQYLWSANFDGGSAVIVEGRTYTLHPGKIPEYFRLYESKGKAIR